MRILLLGKNGQLGWELQRTLPCLGDVIACDYPEIDFTQQEAVRDLVRQTRPQLIVNAAAYTAVDRAESEPEKAWAINTAASAALGEEAASLKAGLVHYSTDYVFDGASTGTYLETDPPRPLNQYGASKLEGENVILASGAKAWVFRTSWVYSNRRDSFVSKVLGWSRSQTQMKVVADQTGCPTWSRALAEVTAQVLAMGRRDVYGWMQETAGLYHLAGDGGCTRLEFAQEILRLDPEPGQQVVTELTPARTADFPTAAQRPLNAILDCSKFKNTFGISLPPWQEALRLMVSL
jgi:dTDP-4-dehydrorhamnose reductase